MITVIKWTINGFNMLLTHNTKLLISLRILYKRSTMLFQWLLVEIKSQTDNASFNFNYYLTNKLSYEQKISSIAVDLQ